MKVLAVDDNKDGLNLLAKQLRAGGFEVEIAKDGVEALNKALSRPPDIFISDILMPEMDGYKLCRECKNDNRLKTIPFVFYTATYTLDEDKKFALGLGADAFILKPAEPGELILRLSELLGSVQSETQTSSKTTQPDELYLAEYNERLVKKLNQKVDQLNQEIIGRKQAEDEVKKHRDHLEELVVERTSELAIANKQLRRELLQRKKHEEQIEHLNDILSAVRNINQLITREKDRKNLIEESCNIFVADALYDHAWISLINKNGNSLMAAGAGDVTGFQEFLERFEHGEMSCCSQLSLLEPGVLSIPVESVNCDCPLYELHKTLRGYSVRLEHEEKVYGTLHVFSPKNTAETKGDYLLLKEVADDIGFALHDIELMEEHEQLEKKLANEKKLLEVTLRSSGDAVIATDVKGKVTILNEVAEKLTGWTEKEAIGKPLDSVFNIVNHSTRRKIPNPVSTVLKTGRIVGLINHAILISKKGSETIIADSGAPIHDGTGKLFGVVLVFRDIAESYRLEAEREKIGKLESIGVLAGGIAHDFNNILTSILGNINLAELNAREEDCVELTARLKDAETASLRARDLTQQLLTFARGGEPVKSIISISKVLEESTILALSGSGKKPVLSIPDDLWVIDADEGQINQVINNIVINADQAMPEGGIINITARNLTVSKAIFPNFNEDDYVEIAIQDYGIGISPDHLQRIFEPYFTTKQKGSGLGLATSYSIITNHGGYLTVESDKDVGTIFKIYLPARKDAVANQNITLTSNKEIPHLRIMVMDDEEAIRNLLERQLKSMGHKTELVKEGTEAVASFGAAIESGLPFDLVIMDLTIPGGMGGKETITKLLEIDPEVKAIVSSGYSNDPIMARPEKYGFSGVFHKPFRMNELRATIQSLFIEKSNSKRKSVNADLRL
jgi:PAS domain S-box-containing protein